MSKTRGKSIFAKVLVIALVGFLIYAFKAYHLGQYLTLDFIKAKQSEILSYYESNQLTTLLVYFLIYVLSTALSLPGATVLTLAGGAFFGFGLGLLVVSFASTLGATLAFLVARFLLRDWIQSKFKEKLAAINQGVEKDGAFYLFTLRLIPLFPFFVINLVMGLTSIRTLTFLWVSQLGMLLGTAVYVNAGTQLAKIDSLKGILSPSLLLSFVLIGIFPILAKKILETLKAKKVYRNFRKPQKFDYNVISIGAGAAGLVSSYIGAAVKAKVALIEKHKMGGDCLNTGCVPSKALIKTAKVIYDARRSPEFGIRKMDVDFHFAECMERVQKVITQIEPHDSIERYTGLGVECIEGKAKILSPFEVEVDGKVRTTKNIILATGARPFLPPIPGIERVKPLTSDNVWELRTLPKRLVVLGGGPIGSELAQSFQRLGSQVTQVEMGPQILSREDDEVSDLVAEQFKKEGIRTLTRHRAKEFKVQAGQKQLVCERVDPESPESNEVVIDFDEVLVAVGRRANTEGFGLEEMGVRLTERGTIEVDEYLRTSFPNIYACGDVAGPYQFTHTAGHQAWFAAMNALLSPFWSFKVDYRVIPWTTFTDPEVARVGLNEKEARAKEIPYQVTTYGIDDLDRAIADEEAHGMVKVLTVPGKDKILGVTIVGHHAGDLLTEYVLAMKYGLGMNQILGTIHTYPTLSEANKYAAGNWKRQNVPEKLLGFLPTFETLKKFHAWRRN